MKIFFLPGILLAFVPSACANPACGQARLTLDFAQAVSGKIKAQMPNSSRIYAQLHGERLVPGGRRDTTLKFCLERSGRVRWVSVLRSSGSPAIDNILADTIKSVAFPQLPPDVLGDSTALTVPVHTFP